MRATLERALAALALLIALPVAAATAAFGTGELMQLLAGVQSSSARFTETRESAVLKAPLIQRGTLGYRRPDHLEKHVDGPPDEHTVLDGTRLTIDSRSRKRHVAIDINSAPALAALVDSIRATRAGDLAALERHYAVSTSGTREAWSLLLRPNQPSLAEYVRKVTVTGSGPRIIRIEVDEATGDRTAMELIESVR